MTASSPQARRIATPSWLDLRLVLGVVLVLASVLIGASVVSRASNTHASVTATRDLAAGTILQADDVRVTQVQLPDNGAGVYVGDINAVIGKSLSRAVSRGELVPAAAVAGTPALARVTVPLASGAAPTLHSGERVEMWLSTATCASVVLLDDVTIQDVRNADSSFGGGSGAQQVVISVDPAQASRVVAALGITGGQIRAAVLVGGQQSATPTLGAVSSSPLPVPSGLPVASAPAGSTGLPADLAACASATPSR